MISLLLWIIIGVLKNGLIFERYIHILISFWISWKYGKNLIVNCKYSNHLCKLNQKKKERIVKIFSFFLIRKTLALIYLISTITVICLK